MAKKFLLILVIGAFAATGAFAQTDFQTMPRNTLTVDFGPTIVGGVFGAAESIWNSLDMDGNMSSRGFGIAAQYERQMSQRISLAGRFSYLGVGMRLVTYDGSARIISEGDLTSIAVEGHARLYPFRRNTFFLGGMLGYGIIFGTYQGEDRDRWNPADVEYFNASTSRNYIRLGTRLGWRFDFGRPGGLVFEPSFGWNLGIGLGESHMTQILRANDGYVSEEELIRAAIVLAEHMVFMGGPRVSFAFGWRF